MTLWDRSFARLRFFSKKPDGFHALSYNFFISQFASGMVSLFGVVFIFQLGATFQQGLFFLLAYYGLQRMAVGVFLPFAGRAVCRLGYRWTMLLGLMAFIMRLLFLVFVSVERIWLLVPAFIMGGIYLPFYFVAYHGMFLDDNDDAKVGEQIGLLTMLSRWQWLERRCLLV